MFVWSEFREMVFAEMLLNHSELTKAKLVLLHVLALLVKEQCNLYQKN